MPSAMTRCSTMTPRDDPRYGQPQPSWPYRLLASMLTLGMVLWLAEVLIWSGSNAVSRSAGERTNQQILSGCAASTGLWCPSINADGSIEYFACTEERSVKTDFGTILPVRRNACRLYGWTGSAGGAGSNANGTLLNARED